jgi:hypothetical protein
MRAFTVGYLISKVKPMFHSDSNGLSLHPKDLINYCYKQSTIVPPAGIE